MENSVKSKVKTILVLCFALQTCALNSPIRARVELVRPWTHELSQNAPYSEPYISRFRKKSVQLTYVAAAHEYGMESDTFRTITEAFNTFDPDTVIVEGFSNLTNERKKKFEKRAFACAKNNFLTCGEGLYGVFLAAKNNKRWTSGAPAAQKIEDVLLKNNYSKQDIAFFYLARQLRQLIVERNLHSENFDKIAHEHLASIAKTYNLPSDLTAELFRAWYMQKMGKPFSLSDVDSAFTGPKLGPNMTYLNRISAIVGKVRDHTIVSVISKELNRSSRVLVIYGGSHFMTQRLALEDMLGNATIEKPI